MPKRNLAWLLIVVVIALLMWQLPSTIAGRDSVLRSFGLLVDARAHISKTYVGEVDDEALAEKAVDAGIRAMIDELGDPYAVYLNARDYERFRERTGGTYGGIGVEVWATGAGLEVLSREPNSPAVQAKLLPGDIITHIDGFPTAKLPLVEAVNNMLNGPSGSRVRLSVVTPGVETKDAPRQVNLFRAAIRIDPVRGWSRGEGGHWRFMLDSEHGVGYLRLTKFTPDADERLREEINRLQRRRLSGLILDLRDNTGGLLDSAREVADIFLDRGLIVRTSGRTSSPKEWFAMREGTIQKMPMAVLVNGSTASAAEIVAGSLRDHDRAYVVGEQTYGKGSVQEVVELSRSGGAIKLTTAYYYLPDGECIHRTPAAEKKGVWGVTPNERVDLTDAQRRKWRAAWREIGREASQSPATRVAVDEAPSAEAAAEAAALLDADVQLRVGLEHLLRELAEKAPRSENRGN